MRQFVYLQAIPRDSYVYAPSAMVHKDVDSMYNDLHNNLALEESRNMSAPHQRRSTFNNIQWYFLVSHSYMTLDA